jgi:hypothetical protein
MSLGPSSPAAAICESCALEKGPTFLLLRATYQASVEVAGTGMAIGAAAGSVTAGGGGRRSFLPHFGQTTICAPFDADTASTVPQGHLIFKEGVGAAMVLSAERPRACVRGQ